jgi:vancomycin resistance protein VanJ
MTASPKNPPWYQTPIHWTPRFPILDIYAILLIVFLLLMAWPRRYWPIELAANLVQWFLLPAIPMLIFLLIKHRWRRAILWVIPTTAFLVMFGALFLPRIQVPRPASPTHLKVMTWNLLAKIDIDRRLQLDVLKNSGSDIIAIQEITEQDAKLIDTLLSGLYPYRILYPKGIHGVGLLSKFPIQSQETFRSTPDGNFSIRAVLDINGKPVTVFSAHPWLGLNISEMKWTDGGVSEIEPLAKMAQDGAPTLLMGDFNLSDQSTTYKILARSGLKDTFREIGWGFGPTWPLRTPFTSGHFLPLVRIDFIWHTPEFHPISIMTGKDCGSDHLPLYAVLDLDQ